MPTPVPERPPVVLCFAMTDPTGATGLSSDLLTLGSMGCHPLGVVTAVSARDTRVVERVQALDAELVAMQARCVLEDVPVHAIKVGALASVETTVAVAEILSDYPDLPLIYDPSLASLPPDLPDQDELFGAITELILPQTALMVTSPGALDLLAADLFDMSEFLAQLALALDVDDDEEVEFGFSGDEQGSMLYPLAMGTDHLLLTGMGRGGPQVIDLLFNRDGLVSTAARERLNGHFLGAGATLAAAAAGALAHGMDMADAVHEAQEFTWRSLAAAYQAGMGPVMADRFFWARPDHDGD